MNRLKLIVGGNPKTTHLANPYRVAQIIPILQLTAVEWTPERLRAHIDSGQVPREYVDLVVAHIKRDPSLALVQIEDFTAAIGHVYPGLSPIVTTPEGYHWLDLCCREITKRLLFSPLLNLLRGV